MTHLTNEALQELTNRINARLAEFGTLLSMPQLAPGVVRIASDVIMEWQDSQPLHPLPSQEPDYDVVQDAYHVGFERGKQQSAPVADTPRQVTVSEDAQAGRSTNGNHAPALSSTAAATLGPEHTVVTPLKSPRSHLPTLDDLVKELRRQSMGGVMPTMAAFDMARPATWATAQAHTKRFETTWGELAERAGLTLKRAET